MPRRRSPAPDAPHGLPDAPHLFRGITHPKKRAMLMAYSVCGVRRRASDMAHIDLRYHFRWLQDDPAYAEAFAEAERMAGDLAEDKIYELALNGAEETVYQQGRPVGTHIRYFPTLLLAAVNAAKPEKYKYRSEVEHTLNPTLLALQEQWQRAREQPQAALPPSYDAEGQVVADGGAPVPGQTSREKTFELLDRLNDGKDAGVDDGEADEGA